MIKHCAMDFLNFHFRQLLLSAVILVLLSTSCANTFNASPSISELTTTTGFVSAYQPADKTDIFFIDSPQICCSAKVNGARSGTEIEANWIYVQGEMSKEAKALIGRGKVHCDSDCYFGFTLPSPGEGFISGEYKVDLLIGGQHKADHTFYIQRERTGSIPQIKSFAANPLILTEGEPLAMSWQVSSATRVNILPSLGLVNTEGKVNLNPVEDTTYTLWAVNRSGTSSSSLSVKVKKAMKTKADLIINDFWYTGTTLYYVVKNAGKLASSDSESYLYKNDVQVSDDYVAPLNPGEERVESFSTYHFSPRFPSASGSGTVEATSDAVNMRMCLNGNSSFTESDETNNCMEHNFGPLLEVSLNRYTANAQWQSSAGALNWPMPKDLKGGWAQLAVAQMDAGQSYPDSIIMTLPINADSWMQARFGIPQGYPVVLQPFTIPHKSKLTTSVGLTRDAPTSANVKFIIGTMQGSDITYYPPVTINTPGKPETYEVDLSKLAGKQVQFIFRVESSVPLQQGSAVWIDPSLTQEK